MPESFAGPKLKVERANYHIGKLEVICVRYLRDCARSVIPKRRGRGAQTILLDANFPRETPLIIGDAIHNLRVSLDHAYWDLVRANGGAFSKYGGFPFARDLVSLKAILNGWKDERKPSSAVLDFILKELEPFESGALSLYELHQLDILDKHELVIPTARSIRPEPNEKMTITLMHPNGYTPINIELTSGVLLKYTTGAPMFAEATKIKYSGEIRNAFPILFGEGPLENQPVLKTLKALSQNVSKSIASLERFLD